MSSPSFRAAIIGCGGIAKAHAEGYRWAKIPIVAAADIREENASALAKSYGIPQTFGDYHIMLAEVKPDIVSVCTWPPLHEEMVIAATRAGVKAIACEKPLAPNLGAADRMIAACRETGTLLVVAHQRRYEALWREGKRLIETGAIGALERVLIKEAGDLLSDGVHGLDLALFWLGDPVPVWVLGQIDRTRGASSYEGGDGGRLEALGNRYGHAVEHNTAATIGVSSGETINIEMGRIRRGEGYIELIALGREGFVRVVTNGELNLVNRDGIKVSRLEDEVTSFGKMLQDAARCLQQELDAHPLEVSAHRQALDIVMAIYQSSRSRGQVELPLRVSESPLEAMIAAGEI